MDSKPLGITKNPWDVPSLDEYLFYCCPECELKTKEYEIFYNHAVIIHELAKQTLQPTLDDTEMVTEDISNKDEHSDREVYKDTKLMEAEVVLDKSVVDNYVQNESASLKSEKISESEFNDDSDCIDIKEECLEDSADNCTSDEEDEVSDNEDIIENEELPTHRFVQEEKVVKSGKSKGQKKYITSLVIPPYTFRRKVDKKVGNTALFTCNLCEKLGYRGVSASAVKTSEDNDGKCEYELTRIPKDHKCVPSSTTHLKKEFTKALYDEVAKNPLKSIGKIYEETRTRFTSQLENEDEKLTFLQDIPKYCHKKSNFK